MLRACLTLICLIPLCSCSNNTPEAMLSDYMWRVANVLDVSVDTDFDNLPALPLLPHRRERILPVTEVRQGLLEVLDLKFCNLLPLIAERNSSLGKVMLPSKQLAYELQFFTLIRHCRDRIEDDQYSPIEPELTDRIREIYQVKRRNLHNTVWNGIYTAREVELQFTSTAEALPLSGDTGYKAVDRSLQHLIQLSQVIKRPEQWQPPAFLDQLESDYGTLNSNPFGGQALRSLQLLTVTMERTSISISRRLDDNPLCFQGHQTEKARILGNVFRKFYANRFQPYLSRVDRDSKAWLRNQQELFSQFTPPSAMQDYMERIYNNPNSLWERYNKARKQHTQAWQALLRQCSMMPGQ